MKSLPPLSRLWISRTLIGLVLLWNVQCAVVFLLFPGQFAPGFEMQGDVGNGMVRALGILFLMWNIPYVVAISHPVRQRISLFEAIAMQATGFAGESLLLLTFPPGHLFLRDSLGRFILFDGAGLLLLIAAWWVIRGLEVINGSAAQSPSGKS